MTHTNAATLQPPLTAEQLPDDPATLKGIVLELVEARRLDEREKAALRLQLDKLLKRIYGPRGERFDPNQRLLFPLDQQEQVPAPIPPAEAQDRPKRKCRPHGRRRLPENLPRQSQHHELTQAERICPHCKQLCEEIGADKSEMLGYKPASLFIVEYFVHKYACPCCGKTAQQPPRESETMSQQEPACQQAQATEATTTTAQPAAANQAIARQGESTVPAPAGQAGQGGQVIISAAKPAMPIPKGMAGPGLLAHLIVSKYVDHLPLYRLERVYERQGVFLPRSTLCDWLMACSQVLRPLYDLMVRLMLRSRALHTDDTPVKMQDPKAHTLSTARMWVYLGDDAHPYNLFDFTVNRKRDGPQTFLAGYRGYLHADAFSGYDCLYLPNPLTSEARIIEVACNAHARRKFFEAQSTDILRSHVALGYYRQLYELERTARDLTEEGRLQMRQHLSLVILDKFHAWMEKERPEVLPKSPMGEALAYALNNWDALKRYTEAGYLTVDNNAAEREMKRVAIGRKNWLFVGSRRGGEAAAVLMSFTSTCNRLGVEPWAYLDDVLTRLPTTPSEGLAELVPDRWQAAQRQNQATKPPAGVTRDAVAPRSES